MGADTPKGDLCLLDGEAVRRVGVEAGGRPLGAVDICRGATRAAYEVVVVVANPSLIARRVAGQFDAPHHAGTREGVQGVVHGLGGQCSQPGARAGRDCLGIKVRTLLERCEDGQAGLGDAQTVRAQDALGIERIRGIRGRRLPTA